MQSRAGVGRVAVRCAAMGAIVLLMTAAVPASIVRAEGLVDTAELQRARHHALYKWQRAIPVALHIDRGKQATRTNLTSFEWFDSVIGLVGEDLLQANPGREREVVGYINQVLIPEMYQRRSDYICDYTRLYYGRTMFHAFANVFEDPFQSAAYFVAPTRGFLEQQNLNFTPDAAHYLERNARFAPDGSFWRRIAASNAHVPCKPQGDADSGHGERL